VHRLRTNVGRKPRQQLTDLASSGTWPVKCVFVFVLCVSVPVCTHAKSFIFAEQEFWLLCTTDVVWLEWSRPKPPWYFQHWHHMYCVGTWGMFVMTMSLSNEETYTLCPWKQRHYFLIIASANVDFQNSSTVGFPGKRTVYLWLNFSPHMTCIATQRFRIQQLKYLLLSSQLTVLHET